MPAIKMVQGSTRASLNHRALRRNNKMSKDGKSGSGQPFDYQGELVIKYYPVWESHRLSDNESLLSSGGIRR